MPTEDPTTSDEQFILIPEIKKVRKKVGNKAVRAAWYQANREKICAHVKIYREANRERINARAKAYREANKDKIRATRRANRGIHRIAEKARFLRCKYGITTDQVTEMDRAQNSCCAICRTSFNLTRQHVDHNHATGKVRGLLCEHCNVGLGYFFDNPKILRGAIAYLKRHG